MAKTTRDARKRNITRRATWQRVYGTQSVEEAARGCNDWINLSLDSVTQPPKIRKGNNASRRFYSTELHITYEMKIKFRKMIDLSIVRLRISFCTIKYYNIKTVVVFKCIYI